MIKKIEYKSRVQYGSPSFKTIMVTEPTSPGRANADIQHDLNIVKKGEPEGIYVYDQNIWIPFVPSPIQLKLPYVVKHIACGAFHSMILTEEGAIYGCGLASSG